MSDISAEHAALVALIRSRTGKVSWKQTTQDVLDAGTASAVWEQADADTLIPDPAREELLWQASEDVDAWEFRGWHLTSILDADYPTHLREVYQAPPFVFTQGTPEPDESAIAIVGSRRASDRGLSIAAALATDLATENVTVLSGLAEGIDRAAHTAALEAGGRTVAILGNGLGYYYPKRNRALQDEISNRGMLLSQFWPEASPQKHSFIMRNAVMSGYGSATVVVEASENSGTRAQARLAVEHGRPVILTDLVVEATTWGRALVDRPGVYVASSRSELAEHVHSVLTKKDDIDRLLDQLANSAL